jgi:hypothetical protein
MRHIFTGALALTALLGNASVFAQDSPVVIANALTAAPISIAENATVMDWAGSTLREGTNGWVWTPYAHVMIPVVGHPSALP